MAEVSRYLRNNKTYYAVIDAKGRIKIILTAKSQRTPFKTTLSGSEDWNIIVNTIKRWKTEDCDRFFIRIDHKFEGVTASTAAKDVRLQSCLVNLDPLILNIFLLSVQSI